MSQSEQSIQQNILLSCSRGTVRLMRNNCGSYKTPEGGFVKYGVGNPGGSDLIGLRSLVVTPQMVGQRIGQFVAVEVKRPGQRPTEQQERFMAMVRQFGGIAGVATSVDEARKLVSSADQTPLAELSLTTAVYHALRRAGFQWIEEVAGMSVDALAELHNIGPGRASQIVNAIEESQRVG